MEQPCPPPQKTFPIIHACIFVATAELVETALKIPTKLRGVCLSVIQSTGVFFFFKKAQIDKRVWFEDSLLWSGDDMTFVNF